jgi:hypothetical protein
MMLLALHNNDQYDNLRHIYIVLLGFYQYKSEELNESSLSILALQ